MEVTHIGREMVLLRRTLEVEGTVEDEVVKDMAAEVTHTGTEMVVEDMEVEEVAMEFL